MGWGSCTRRGGGQKLRALPRKFVFLGFRREEPGMSREFCQDVPDPWGCSKSLCLKSSCAFYVPDRGRRNSKKQQEYGATALRGFGVCEGVSEKFSEITSGDLPL